MPEETTIEVRDNEAAHRYEAWLGDELAGIAEYEPAEGRLVFVHTEVFAGFEGRGVGSRLAAGALDDVMDAMDDAANLFTLYRITAIRPGVREIVATIIAQTREIRMALGMLEKYKGVLERSIEINRLEHEADEIHRRLIGALFDEEADSILLIKWKDILTYLERATDRAEDVANLLESIVVKHG